MKRLLPLLTLLAAGLIAQTALAQAQVSLAFVGDVMLADTPGRVLRQGRDPFAPFAALLKEADLRIANLECVVATGGRAEPGKPWTFRVHPRALPVLQRHFDAVSLANNHSGDYGPQAFAEMLGRLERAGLPYFGGGRNASHAHTPWVVERQGVRIALLGYNEFFPRSFEADADSPGVAWSEDAHVRLDITEARQRYEADIVIPFMHWGLEDEPLASDRQRQLARWMIDAGADAVVGSHPHVTQDIEIYQGKPIVYSLGNFVFDGFSSASNNTGWLLKLNVDKHGVRSFRTHIGQIDREGIPHPDTTTPGSCWSRGAAASAPCPSGSPAR